MPCVTRRHFFTTAGGALAAAGLGRAAARPPNIVVILSDDHGYAEMGVQGCRDVPTPNLDAMAGNGIRFTNGYVSCPVCSPTRAGLNTGRYQQRFGHEFNPGPAATAAGNFGLPLSETTLADRLKRLGYRTGAFGKWHLGYRPEYHPQKRGFDEFFGFLGGAHSYLDWSADKANPLLRGTQPVDEKTYLTEAFAREASAFIERHRNQPFFVYLPFNAVHGPLQAIQKYLDRFAIVADERRRTFAAMLSAIDDAVGTVMNTLRRNKLEENTLVFFLSDNGGPTLITSSRNDPLRGYKGQVLEGGIRIPYMVQWKGHLPAGRVYDQPVISLDIVPTAVMAAGGQAPPGVDGVNLMPYLTGKAGGRPHDRLYWRFGPQAAIRSGDWKLLRQTEGQWELYNLARDIGEKNNLAAAERARVKEMAADWEHWNSQLMAPRWVPVRRRGKLGGKRAGKRKRQ